ncbi:hypothetical protein ACSBR2_024770 [Camellia fascicularis]
MLCLALSPCLVLYPTLFLILLCSSSFFRIISSSGSLPNHSHLSPLSLSLSLSIALFLIVLPNHLLFRFISESFERITSSLLSNDTGKFILTPESQRNEQHCNYFKFADDDDGDVTSTIHSNSGPRKAIETEEFNDVRARLSEMKNEIHEHGRRLQRMDNNFKAMIYVILVCIVLYFIM